MQSSRTMRGGRAPSREAWAFRPAWRRGQRCIIPVEDFDEPYWGTGKNIWWRFRRADGQPLAIAGLWNEWKDPTTGEVIPSYTMLTINCNAHPLLCLMHRPDLGPDKQPLPAHEQDKRTIVTLEQHHLETWLHGSREEAAAVIQLPGSHLYAARRGRSWRNTYRCRSKLQLLQYVWEWCCGIALAAAAMTGTARRAEPA